MVNSHLKNVKKTGPLFSSLPLTFQLIKEKNKNKITPKLIGQSIDLSDLRICMETNNVIINGIHVLNEAMDNNNLLEIEISLPKEPTPLTIYTKVLGYELTPENASRRLRVYLGIKDVATQSKEKWEQLLHKPKDVKSRLAALFYLLST